MVKGEIGKRERWEYSEDIGGGSIVKIEEVGV